jgi:small subunit ribosomal protein S6
MEKNIKKYEITFITSEDLKEKPVKTAIEKFGGKILKSDFLGEKQFTYKIEKKTKGFYATVIFEINPEKMAELNKILSLDEEIIRFLLISAERNDFTAPERKSKETALEKPTGHSPMGGAQTELEIEPPLGMQKELIKVEPEKKIAKPKVKKETVKEPVIEKVKEVKKDKKVEEITAEEATEEERLKALDKKLDELLKE